MCRNNSTRKYLRKTEQTTFATKEKNALSVLAAHSYDVRNRTRRDDNYSTPVIKCTSTRACLLVVPANWKKDMQIILYSR